MGASGIVCPHCANDDKRQMEYLGGGVFLCSSCSKTFKEKK